MLRIFNKEWIKRILSHIIPEVTGTIVTNQVNNTIQLPPGSIDALELEVGDIIQVIGSGSNDKVFTVEGIGTISGTPLATDQISVNWEHSSNRANGPLRLVNGTFNGVTIKRISKWYSASTGIGQKPVNPSRAVNTNYVNNTGRPFFLFAIISKNGQDNFGTYALLVDGVSTGNVNPGDNNSIANIPATFSTIIPPGSTYRINQSGAGVKVVWSETR